MSESNGFQWDAPFIIPAAAIVAGLAALLWTYAPSVLAENWRVVYESGAGAGDPYVAAVGVVLFTTGLVAALIKTGYLAWTLGDATEEIDDWE